MKFNVKSWRNTYNLVNALGKTLKDSYPTIDENNVSHPAICPLGIDQRTTIEKKIKILLSRSDKYLNECDLRYNAALWKYNIKDKSTWASETTFKYGHLLRYKK